MPLTSDTVEELDRLIDIFFEKVGRKERLRKQILKLMDESEAYLYPKIREWMQLSRKQIIRDIKNGILKIEKKSKSQIVIDYVDWETIEEKGKSIIKPAYLNIMEKSGNLSLAQARIEASFDVINPRSVEWAEKYSSELVTLVGKNTKAGLRAIVGYGLKEGKTLTQIAKDIEATGIGLNVRQTKALYKYRNLLEAQKVPQKIIKDKFNKYYDRLRRDRSKLIARTEASRSANEGYLDSLEGTRYEEVELSTAADACSDCLDLAGQKFKRSEASGMLPVHPNCRCHWIVVIPRKRKKPRVPARPTKPSDIIISKYKDSIEEQRKLTNEISLYRRKLGNVYYREKDRAKRFVDLEKYRALMKEAQAKRRLLINKIKRGMRKDLYVDKALRPDITPHLIFADIEPAGKRKILDAINEFEKYVDKKVVHAYDILIKNMPTGRHRAYYQHGGVFLSKWEQYHTTNVVNKTVIHEMGHFLEDTSSEVFDKVQEFYRKRTKGCPLVWMGEGYKTTELTRKDNFIEAYMGKDYGGRASEITSMGLEYFYNDPYKLATKDPGYFNFIFNLVRGIK
jgi:hypothetical protein